MTARRAACLLITCIASWVAGDVCRGGTLTILERESNAANSLFAGSGGAVRTRDESDATTSLTGAFSFSDSGAVEVTESDPTSNGSASASGSIAVAENVQQPTPGSLSVSASRSASGMAMHGSGTGSAFSYQNQELRVRFTVNGDDASYTLTGTFDPGVITTLIGEQHSVRLYRPFTSNVLVDIDEMDTVNESGTLVAGRTYEFRVLLNDRNVGNAGNPSNSDASNFDLEFNVVSVPEPPTALLACCGAVALLALRKRCAAS